MIVTFFGLGTTSGDQLPAALCQPPVVRTPASGNWSVPRYI